MSAFHLRIPDDLMRRAKKLAKINRTSLNQFILAAIAEQVGAETAAQNFARLAAKADEAAFRRILARVPDMPAIRGDELPRR